MPIKHSPGCQCCGCAVEYDYEYDTAIAAATPHTIPFTVPQHTFVDFGSLVDHSYFWDETATVKVRIWDTALATLHETLTFQAKRDNADFTEGNQWIGYDTRNYRRYMGVDVSGTQFEKMGYWKNYVTGMKFVRIKSVTAGTFDRTEKTVYSILKSFTWNNEQDCGLSDPKNPMIMAMEKDQAVIMKSETAIDINAIRGHVPTGDDSGKSPTIYATKYDQVSSGAVNYAFANNVHFSAGTSQFYRGSLASGYAGYVRAVTCYPMPILTDPWSILNYETRVYVINDDAATGDGHFALELSQKAHGIEGTNTTIRLYRTGGNSTAVTVTVAVGNSDVNIAFAAGETYKDVTVANQAHDGTTTTITAPTNDQVSTHVTGQSDHWGLSSMIFRGLAWELGGYKLRKQAGTIWFGGYMPFSRSVWPSSSVKLTVEASVATTLEQYVIYEVKHLGHCGTSDDNLSCPEFPVCSDVSEYHGQQIDVTSVTFTGLPAAMMPDYDRSLHEGCVSTHYWDNDSLGNTIGTWYATGVKYTRQFEAPETVWQVWDRPADFWTNQNSSSSQSSSCGSFTWVRDYSNMPTGHTVFSGAVGWCNSYSCGGSSGGIVTEYAYPAGTAPDPPIINPSNCVASGCIDINQVTSGTWTSDNGINYMKIRAEAHKPMPIDKDPTGGSPFLFTHEDGGRWGQRVVVDLSPTVDILNGSVWELDAGGAAYSYVGQEWIPTLGAKITTLSPGPHDWLDGTNGDIWYNVSGDPTPANDGYWRIYYNGGTPTQSGPYVTATDGTNTFSALTDLGLSLWMEIGYYLDHAKAAYDVGEPCVAHSPSLAGCPSNVTSSDTSFTADWYLFGPTASGPVEYDLGGDTNGFCVKEIGMKLNAGTPGICLPAAVEEIAFTWGTPPSSPYTGDKVATCTPTAIADEYTLGFDPSMAPPTGWSWKEGTPTEVTGSCSYYSPGNPVAGYQFICCGGGTPTYGTLNWSYDDYDGLPDWDSRIIGTEDATAEFVYGIVYAGTIVMSSITGGGSSRIHYGPNHVDYGTSWFWFPIKWGSCWSGMNVRTETFTGSTDIRNADVGGSGYSINLASDPIHIVKGQTVPTPAYTQHPSATDPEDPYYLLTSASSSIHTLSKDDITVTVGAYSPLWSK